MEYITDLNDKRLQCSCGLQDFQLCQVEKSNGTKCFRFQCKNCGWTSDFIKTVTIPTDIDLKTLPFVDDELKKEYSNKRSELYYEQEKQKKEAEWKEYQDYLISYEWRKKRQEAIDLNKKLNGGVCQRCGCELNDSNTQVHHKTYYNSCRDGYKPEEMRVQLKGKEHIFDLEVLCENCHNLLHPHLYYKNQNIYQEKTDLSLEDEVKRFLNIFGDDK